ncbi:MAG: hypothetical protein M1823_003293 [Watsoniomyces obsoletus]|nr:MAG: hypothetical protein M1823_003293 [Watsoniomyces obsoletus]
MADSLPKTFKAVVVEHKDGPMTLKDVPLEQPKAGEILIKVLAVGVCHSDSLLSPGIFGNPFPMIPGHEVIGDVVALGPNESNWTIGERAGGPWHGGHDSTCKQCRRGQYQMCDHEEINGFTRRGGYAEYMIMRTEASVRIPKDVDAAEFAPLLCAGVTTFNSMRSMGVQPGSVVAVQGLGGLGHLAIQFAAKMGYRVVALSSSAGKEDFAKQLGAHEYVDGSKQNAAEYLQSLGGASLIVSTAPNPKAVEPLLYGLRAYGTLLVLAALGNLSVDTGVMIQKALSVRSWASGHALDSEETIEFARQQGIKCMIERYPLQDFQKAYDSMMSGKARFRAVLVME